MTNSIVSNFIFHKGLDGNWEAVSRDNYFDLFNDRSKVLYRSSSIATLEELIILTKGDATQIDNIVRRKSGDVSFHNIMDEVDRLGCKVPQYPEDNKEHY